MLKNTKSSKQPVTIEDPTMMIGRSASSRALALCARRRVASASSMRCMSTENEKKLVQVVSLERLAHQGRVHLNIADAARTNIRVVPTLLQSEFALRVFSNGSTIDSFTATEHVDEENGPVKEVQLSKVANGTEELDVELSLPHLVDLNVVAVRGSVKLSDKIEGNVRVTLSEGDITVNKVRGEVIELKTNRGNIDITSLVEGEKVKLIASAVKAKRLMSSSTEIKLAKGSEDSELGAIYSSLCLVNSQSTGTLTIGNIHGFLRVNGEEMKAVHVNSVNGALHIEDSGSSCDVEAYFDAWSSDAANKIFVGGNVRVCLDPSAPIDVELHGSKITTGSCKFSESELDQLDEDYAIFTGSLQPGAVTASTSTTSGKINVGSAKNSALRTSFFATDNDASDQGATFASSDIHPAHLPRLVVHASNGTVTLEQLDWMGKIKRQHLAK